MSADEYFNLLSKLMVDNPPASADKPVLEKMANMGLVPGQPIDSSKLSTLTQKALAEVPTLANAQISAWMKEGIVAGDMKLENGWGFTVETGIYGTNYMQRAFITAIGLGANRPQDLKRNADPSVELYIQNQSPGADKESNWLPAPKDKFILMLRLYWPKETPPSIIDGSWKIPAVEVVK